MNVPANRRRLALLLPVLLAGCTMAPDYQRPAADGIVEPAWPKSGTVKPVSTDTAGKPTADLIGWRDFYTDPRLQRLIERSLANNGDLRVAVLNVARARAQYQISDSLLFPTVDGVASADIEKTPKTLSQTGSPVTSHAYSLSLGTTSYELDLFGRVRSLKDQALHAYLALQETQTSVQITLVSEVAGAWFTWLADRDLLRFNTESLATQRQSVDALRQSRKQGVISELSLRDAEALLHSSEADVAQATRQVAQSRNALEQLLGEPLTPEVEVFLTQGGGLATSSVSLPQLPPGLPSDLLTRRPDLRAAEQTLQAYNANIGAARAAFFPSVTLTAAVGTGANGMSGLFAKGSGLWQFAPEIRLPIFDGGVNAANLKVSKIDRDIALTQYKQTIQTAFRETADALAARATYEDQLRATEQEAKDAEESYNLSLLRFHNGIDTLLNTLTRQRTFLAAQQTAINLRLARLQNLVTLYRVLGGGWQEGGKKEAESQAEGTLPSQ
ncbi:outer membrane protein, multidrug efflux system [Verrucomicrobium sp. GAS474]|uniref:efflux transporter outer membrane subunit n=1 Tax=Verrucomicrobium sp. GAS474 TaxID=1882831 RepID=UPI00087BAC89|nr:efflux transporter outer membrane subunit [Verrucomicrobium sp. GAS474]SDU00937.1 outer membrane protein, multidrug efflux system [Verrucomicrobium sp. GAS474]